jgi:hypothetical protein
MRRILCCFIILAAAAQIGCSVINNFVVINASHDYVEVRYKLKSWTGLSPRTLPTSQLGKQIAWQVLPDSSYRMDRENLTIILRLDAGEALLVDQCRPANGESSGDCEEGDFSVERVAIIGTAGKIDVEGEQAHRAFVYENQYRSYALTYE